MNWSTLDDYDLRIALARRLGFSYWSNCGHVETLIKFRRNNQHRAPVLIEELLSDG